MPGIGLIHLILTASHKTLLLAIVYIGGDGGSASQGQVLGPGLIHPKSEAGLERLTSVPSEQRSLKPFPLHYA